MTEKKERDIDFKYNLKVYWGLLSQYKPLAWAIVVIVFLLELSYIVDKFLFKLIIDNGTKFAEKTLSYEMLISVLLTILIVYLMIMLLRPIGNFFKLYLINKLENKIILDVKRKYFNHIVHLSYNFHTTHKSGSLISRIIRGGGAVERLTDVLLFNAFPLLFQIIIVSSSLFYFDWASAIVIIITALAFIGYSIFIQQIQREHGKIRNEEEDKEKAYVSDVITNIESIKYFGKENNIKLKFKNISDFVGEKTIKFWNYFCWLDAGQALIIGIGSLGLVYFPIRNFLDGSLTIGSLVFIYSIYSNIIGNLFGFVHGIRDYYRSMTDFEDLFQYGKIENDIKDKENAETLHIKDGKIEFKDVSFQYNKKHIFKNFNLKINKNEKVAIVGHSGSGKSTLIRLLYRLYDLENGSISIDGKDIKEFKQETLREELSIVPQECILFDDTIYNNILFSRPNATREEVLEAIKFAKLDQIIEEFPNKEETIVGERGIKLSGGEKQRVSIARAILANKKVLILDEATSSLDSQTEYEIQGNLKELMKNRTSIVIAHRLSTIMNADKIVVLKKGEIVQMGSHEQLIEQEGEYKHLWNLQKGGYIK